MVEKREDRLKSYKAKFESEKLSKGEQSNADEVILFFSFDVVNSSLYKSTNYYGWAHVLLELFKKLHQRVKEAIDEAELWRVLGDEAIFIVRIKSEEDIYKYIDNIFDVLRSTIKDLKSGIFFENIKSFSDREISLMKIQNILSLKAATWIARVSRTENDENGVENLFEEYELDNRNRFHEFLGNDIDAGFRIAKYTEDSRLVVSFELAVLLSKRSNYLNNLSVITYKHLKGIWNEKYYPIIWYHNKVLYDQLALEETFDYDAMDRSELVREYFANRNDETRISGIRDPKMFENTLFALNKIETDRGLTKKIEKILEIIKQTENVKKAYLKTPTMELHCVAVCYRRDTKQILIARRSDKKENNPKKWEFGCAKADRNTKITDSIIAEYKEDFGIVIEPIVDKGRSDCEPVPIALYQIPKSNGLHKGIIVLAFVKDDIPIKEFVKTSKHSEIRWIKKEDADQYCPDECVEDFHSTLKLAFKKFEEEEK